MPKHAYLILAHNDIPLLDILVSCLDDSRNDIFVHWDAKSGDTPRLKVRNARLFMLDQRVRVNWAGYSMVEAEYLLFKKAYANGPYTYYHLLSGADLPIKSQDYIHAACERLNGTEFVGFAPATQAEIDFRVQHRFLFPESFRTKNPLKRGLRFLYLKIQDFTHARRTSLTVKKGAQWCSLTQDFVAYLLQQEAFVKALFSHTFCPDELFIQTVIVNSPFANRIKDATDEYDGNMRFIKWVNGELIPIFEEDLQKLKVSDKWFARKFSSSNNSFILAVAELSR